MEIRIQHIFLITLLFITSFNISAAENEEEPDDLISEETDIWDEASKTAEPNIQREKIDVDAIDAYDLEIGVYAGQMSVVDFGTNPVTGIKLAYHVTENLFAQLSYGITDTEPSSFEVISGTNLLTEEQREYAYYDLSLGYNILPGESFVTDNTVFNSAFYGTLGIGSTDFAGDQRYTYSVGLGYRLLMNDWLALYVEVKDHVFDIDILGEDKTTHNINLTLGATVFF